MRDPTAIGLNRPLKKGPFCELCVRGMACPEIRRRKFTRAASRLKSTGRKRVCEIATLEGFREPTSGGSFPTASALSPSAPVHTRRHPIILGIPALLPTPDLLPHLRSLLPVISSLHPPSSCYCGPRSSYHRCHDYLPHLLAKIKRVLTHALKPG